MVTLPGTNSESKRLNLTGPNYRLPVTLICLTKIFFMKELENPAYLWPYLFFNALAFFMLFASWKWPKIARLLFVGLFAWACWMNWKMVITNPKDYLQYAPTAFSSWYREFINGWFSEHILLVVGSIATCQGMI